MFWARQSELSVLAFAMATPEIPIQISGRCFTCRASNEWMAKKTSEQPSNVALLDGMRSRDIMSEEMDLGGLKLCRETQKRCMNSVILGMYVSSKYSSKHATQIVATSVVRKNAALVHTRNKVSISHFHPSCSSSCRFYFVWNIPGFGYERVYVAFKRSAIIRSRLLLLETFRLDKDLFARFILLLTYIAYKGS